MSEWDVDAITEHVQKAVTAELLQVYGVVPVAGKSDHCPKCDDIMRCPCSNCRKYHPYTFTQWVLSWLPFRVLREKYYRGTFWTEAEDGEVVTCTKCGFTAHVDFWLDWSMACHRLQEEQDGMSRTNCPSNEPTLLKST